MSRRAVTVSLLLFACAEESDPKTLVETSTETVEVATDAAPVVGEIPEQQAWVDVPATVMLAAWVSDDGAPAAELEYRVTDGPGVIENGRWTGVFDSEGEASVSFSVTDAGGQVATGELQVQVRMPVDAAVDPVPSHDAVGVPVDVVLSWDGGGGADAFDVYLCDSVLDAANATTEAACFVGRTDSLQFDAGRLAADTTFAWRVDARLGDAVWPGPVWTFRTEAVNSPPEFAGVQGVEALGGDALQVSWLPGDDLETPASALVYQVFAGSPVGCPRVFLDT